MTPPAAIDELITDDIARRFSLRCEAAEIPGTSFGTTDMRFNGGSLFRVPTSVVYTDLNLQFLVSADMSEKIFFDYWVNLIRDQDNMYAYYDDIKTNITLQLLTPYDDQVVYGINFIDCWPIGVNPIQLSWEDNNPMRLGVTFTYHHWEALAFAPLSYSTSSNLPSSEDSGVGGVIQGLAGGYLNQVAGQIVRKGISLAQAKVGSLNPVTKTAIGAGIAGVQTFFGG